MGSPAGGQHIRPDNKTYHTMESSHSTHSLSLTHTLSIHSNGKRGHARAFFNPHRSVLSHSQPQNQHHRRLKCLCQCMLMDRLRSDLEGSVEEAAATPRRAARTKGTTTYDIALLRFCRATTMPVHYLTIHSSSGATSCMAKLMLDQGSHFESRTTLLDDGCDT